MRSRLSAFGGKADIDQSLLTNLDLCRQVYDVKHVEKGHRVAVTRALARILPHKGWAIAYDGGAPIETCLFNRDSLTSCIKLQKKSSTARRARYDRL